jgi:TolA-binding protein
MRVLTLARSGSLALALVLVCAPLSVRAQQATEAATRQYNAAVGLYKTEEYNLAADVWLGFIEEFKTDPRVAKAWHYLGVCYFKQNKLDEAAKAFQNVVDDYPKFELLADTYLNLGLTQYNAALSGKTPMYDTAAATFNTLVEKYPNGKHLPEAIYYHGECLYNRNKKKEAAEKYALVVKDYAQHSVAARALFALGVTRADLGQHQAALGTYEQFLNTFPENALVTETVMWRGESLYALGDFAKAVESYATAAEDQKFPMADYATVRQADALAALKQYAEAAAVYASVPAKFKKSQYVELCNLEAGKKYYAAGDFSQAQSSLEKVVAGGGKSAPEAAHWIARSLLKQSKPAEALSVVEKILPRAGKGPQAASLLMDQADAVYELPERRGESVALYAALAEKYPQDPLAPQALYMAAFAAMGQGDHQAALNHADAFLADYADHELHLGAMHVKAESSLLSNQYAEAEKLYDQLLQEAPNDRDAEIWKVHRGTAMYLQKKYQETIEALQPVVGQIRSPNLAAEAWYRTGRSQAALKQFAAAAKSLEASLAAEPKWKLADDAHLVLAYAYQQAGNLAKAKENARKVIADFPDSKLLDMAHYRLGECSRLDADLKTAAREYGQIIDKWPQSPLMRHALYGLGWAQLGREDYADAEATFSTLVEKYPGDKLIPRTRYGRAVARRQLKKYAAAIEDLQALLAAAGTAPQEWSAGAEKSQARHILGLCQKGLNKFDDAVATFRKLFEEDPNYADADSVYFELGWALKSLDKEAEAAQTFTLLTEKFPDSSLAADSHYLSGDFQYEKKDYRKAAKAYYVAMNKAGKTKLGEEAAYKLGLAYYLLDDFENARQSFKYQRATWPKGPLVADAALMEAECLFNEKKYEEALPLYELVENPSNKDAKALALLHAGSAAGQLKDWKKSLDLLTRCADEFPESPHLAQALYEQGWARQNLGNVDEAMALYTQVIAKSNLEPAARAQFMIGEIQFQQKKHAEAIKSFFKVSYGYGYPRWQADATYEAARCFEVLGKRAQALTQYKRLVDEFPESDKVPLAKERIEQLQ